MIWQMIWMVRLSQRQRRRPCSSRALAVARPARTTTLSPRLRLRQAQRWSRSGPRAALGFLPLPLAPLFHRPYRPLQLLSSHQRVTEFAHTHDIEWCELTPRPEAGVGDTLLFCKKCCQYATSKPLGLGKACPSFGVVGWQRNEAAQHKMRRFLQGKHPRCAARAR